MRRPAVDLIAADRRHLVQGLRVASGYTDPGRLAASPAAQREAQTSPAAQREAQASSAALRADAGAVAKLFEAEVLAGLLAWSPEVPLPSVTGVGLALFPDAAVTNTALLNRVARALAALQARGVVQMWRPAGSGGGPGTAWALRIVASGVVLLSRRAPREWAREWPGGSGGKG